MAILGSVSRYLKTCGRLMYTDPQGFGLKIPARRRRNKNQALHSAYLDMLEPRVLMTTVHGGDAFQYTDALGNTVTANLNGNVEAELVSAVQVGGTSGRSVTTTGGYLMLGDITGKYTSGALAGVIVGNGSLPVNNGTQGSATRGNAGAHITVAGDSWPNLTANPAQPGNQMVLQTVATNASGNTYTFNIFDVQPNGSLTLSPLDPSSQGQDFTMQVIQIDNSTMTGTVVYTINSDQNGTILPLDGTPFPLGTPNQPPVTDTSSTFTFTNVGVRASAFNPIDNMLYFEIHYVHTFTPGSTGGGGGGGASTASTVTNVDELYKFDPAHPSNGFVDVGPVNVAANGTVSGDSVTGMAFTLNATAPTTATLYVSEQPTADGLSRNPALQARLLSYGVNASGSIATGTPVTVGNLWEGYGGARVQLNGVVGLATMPASQDGGGQGFLFALINNTASSAASHVARIDLMPVNGTLNATAWGNSTDLYESTAKKAVAPFDGQSLTGLSFNPTLVDPFTGQLGAFESIDTATTNLDFVNHKLRIDAGDVYSVYTSTSDINSSIVFQGTSFYAGDSGALGGVATPGNTGTVFIGYKGQIPDNSTNDTFASSTPFLSARITGSIGVMPGLIADTTDPTVSGAPIDKLFPGLDVTRSLQTPFNATANIADQTLGSAAGVAFNNVTGLAISPDQQIAVVNSFYYNGAAGDQLAFVNATSGMIDATSTIFDVVLTGSGTPLKNLEGLAYGDPGLTGTAQLYAVYDLGNGYGPMLGTLATANGATAIFTPISALGLGANARVSSIAFTPGGTAADRTHESLYVVADPNNLDFNATQYLYQANFTFSGSAVTAVAVAHPPSFDPAGNVLLAGTVQTSSGIGAIQDASGNSLHVVSMVFDASGNPLVLDRTTGRLEDINLNTAVAGVNFVSGTGQISPTVSSVALDPVTLKFFVADNITGTTNAVTITGTDSSPITASSILMQLKDLNLPSAAVTSLGKFLVDGTISGKITVPGSMDMLYAGWLMTGNAGTTGSWFVAPSVNWGTLTGATTTTNTPESDTTVNENYFRNNIYVGGDLRSVVALTSIGTNGILPGAGGALASSYIPGGTSGTEITVVGKLGVVQAKGTVAAVVHALNQSNVPGLVDFAPAVYESTTDAYSYTFRGSASGTSAALTSISTLLTGTSSALLTSSGALTLTTGGAGQAGSAFNNNTVPIDSFTASFVSASLPVVNGTSTYFDGGYAFVLQNQGLPALGASGSGLGYTGILHSAGLGFFYNPVNDLITMQLLTNGATVSSATTLGSFSSTISGTALAVGLTYSNNTLLVNVTDGLGDNVTASYSINLANILGSHAGYVGFTGSTGTHGSTTDVQAFIYNGSAPGTTQLAQSKIQNFNVDSNYTFAAGYLTANGTNAPFANTSFQTAQYLGSVRNATPGMNDTIHLAGVLEGATPTNPPPTINQRSDWYSFSLLAGQTVSVSVVPRTSLLANSTSSTDTASLVDFAIYDPDGNQIATDLNWKGSADTQDRTISFTADRPGAYRVVVAGSGTTNFTSPTSDPGNITYDLTVRNAGNFGIGAVTAGNQVYLAGSRWITSSTANTGSTIVNPSIWADSGDVGLVQAGFGVTNTDLQYSIISNLLNTSSGANGLGAESVSGGFAYTGSSSQDIFVPSGNLRAVVAGQIGAQLINSSPPVIYEGLDIDVSGTVGLIKTNAGSPVSWPIFSKPAGGDVQVVDATGGNFYGIIRTNQAIGVVRAGTVEAQAMLHVDADRTGADGVIDLIDVTGNWDGAPIVSGPGGNVRFMRVGGTLFQDPIFETTGTPSNNGGIIHNPGPWTYTDDSGAVITLTPSTLTTTSSTGTVTTVGVLTTRTYGVRGAGGVVLVDVTSTTGLTVSVAPGGTGRNIGDIGTINVQGTGVPVQVVNGVPVVGGTTGTLTAGSPVNVTLASSGGAVVNALDIRGTTIDTISNQSGGDIYNVNASNVGFILSSGNIGAVTNTTGAALIPATGNFGGGTFPFDGSQYAGVNVANVGVIQAGKSVGNVLVSGVVGTITADAGGASSAGQFYGLSGLIMVNGGAAQTTSSTTTINGVATTTTLSTQISISNVNIGQGIAFEGSAVNPHTGIYATDMIKNVTGSNADIRGNIVSTTHIGTVSLTNGSIINSQIGVLSSWQMVDSAFNNLVITLPNPTTVIDQPVYVIDLISVQGNGGILGSTVWGSSINTINVGANGFGIIGSDIEGVDIGTIHSISAGGYGIISANINDARVQQVSATGSGAPMALSAFAADLLSSQTNAIDASTEAAPNQLSDLAMFMLGDGITSVPVPWGLVTGVLGTDAVTGKDTLGPVSAFDIFDSTFTFPSGTGAITVRNNVDDSEFITGNVASISVAHDATNMEVSVAGQIGPVFIGGNFMPGTNQSVTALSQIEAKGANGNITSFVDKGNFGGLLLAEGSLGSAVVGTAGTKTAAGTGDLSGTITIGSNHLTTTAMNSLTIYGSVITGGLLDLSGQIGTVSIGGGITSLAQPVIVHGSIASFLLGVDPLVNGSDLANTVTLTGNLGSATITGQLSGALIVEGNVGKFALNTDPLTTGTAPLTGSIAVGGTLTNAAIQGSANGNIVAGVVNGLTLAGNLAGEIVGGKSILSTTINGDIVSGATVSSLLGDIKSLTVKGNINGDVEANSGALSALTLTGAIGPTATLSAQSMGALTVPGAVAGSINSTNAITSLKAGSVASTASITAGSLATLNTTGDLNGILHLGDTTAINASVGGNFGGQLNVQAPLSMTVAGNMLSGASIVDSNALTSLTVKGSLSGSVVVDRLIGTIAAGSVANAVLTAGQGLNSLKVTGLFNNSLVNVGLSRGQDNVWGTNDLNEQARMGDLGTLSVGTMNNSIVAVGGNIGSFTVTGNMSQSSVAAGLVLSGASIATILADGSPLSTTGKQNAARMGATLLHGNITSASVGKVGTSGATMFASAITAGVSPGADGAFGNSDDNTNTSLTGGTSVLGSFKGTLDGASTLEANASKSVIPGFTPVNYTTGAGANSILSADPISGSPTLVVTSTTPGTLTVGGVTLTVKVTGTGATVSLYDNATTTDRVDTLLISSTTSSPVSVTVTTSNPAALALGRVIATAGTQVSSFIFNGDILGDVAGGPSLWINSDMSSFAARNIPNDDTWNGVIGGNVGNLTLNQMGPGKLRIGGRITTLNVASSAGNPLLQQLGVVTPPTSITQLAFNPVSQQTYATDGANLLNVDVNTGAINSTTPVTIPLTNATVSIAGLAFDASGNLYGVATLNSQNPVNQLGAITTTGDTLHGLAISPTGTIYAVDSQTGVDELVTLDATSGAETVVGVIRDSHANTFTNNIVTLAFDQNGNLLALTNDRDGNGSIYGTANGYAVGKILTVNGLVRLSSPLTTGAAGDPILLNGGVTNSLSAMAVNATGGIYVVENTGAGVQQLDTLTINPTAGTAALAAVGSVKLGGANTSLVGIGVDENGNVIGLNRNGTNSELIAINATSPTLSVRLDAPGLINQSLAAFAVGKSGSAFTTYAYTTNATGGGLLFASPGVTSTLGQISTTGTFTQLLPLARNATGAPLLGNVTGVAVDAQGDIFAISDRGYLAQYSAVDGSLIGGQPVGLVKDGLGNTLNITRIAFNANGVLVGISATGNNLVQMGTTSTLQNGVNVALASDVTDVGTAVATDLTALSFDAGLGQVLSYSSALGSFVELIGATPTNVGGLIANSIGTANLPDAFTSRVLATGGGGVVTQGIDTLKLVGTAGTFTGLVSAVNSIGSVSGAGVTFNGAIVSHADIKSISLAGSVGANGVFSADTNLSSFSFTGDMGGHVVAQSAGTVAIKGSILAGGLVDVADNLATLSVTGSDSGLVTLGTSKSLALTGKLMSGASITIQGPAGAITLGGGTQLGSLLLAQDLATTVTVGGTLAGVVGIRKSITTATLANLSNGIFAVGGDITTLNVTGSANTSILASGVWLGNDGLYNTADDIIYGGTIANAKIGGTFTNSLITAGVLPPEGVGALTNNIPFNYNDYNYTPGATVLASINGADGGGIGASYIQNITFAKPVVSTNPGAGVFSALVAADGIGKVGSTANTVGLQQIVRNDPPGAPSVNNIVDPTTGLSTPDAVRFTPGEIRITFNQPLDSSTLNTSTISATDSATGNPITDLTFGYFQQPAADGSTESVLQIFSASNFNGVSGVTVQLKGSLTAPTIAGVSGMRSALLAYPNDPFGVTFRGGTFVIGAPSNDNLAGAIAITGNTVVLHGSNVNATAETNEPAHGNFAASSSVWWTWTNTATTSQAIQFDTIGSNFSTTLEVYSGTSPQFGALTPVGSDSNGSISRVRFIATAGATYYIVVDGVGQTGNIELNVSVPQPPGNDNFSSAQTLTGFPAQATGSNFLATSEISEPTHGGSPANHSIWYSWTPTASQTVSVSTLGSNFQTLVDVYTGSSLATLSPVALTSPATTLDTFDKPADLLLYTPVNSALGTPLTSTTAAISTAAAHDGPSSLQLNGDEWLFRTDPAAYVKQGTTISAWVMETANSGRIYVGFGSSAGGTLSMVMGDNTNQLILQDNSGFGFTNIAAAPQAWIPNKWYRFEVTWGAAGLITGNLYDTDGTTLLNTVSATDNTVQAGGIALRGFGGANYVDTVTTTAGGAFQTFNALAGTTYYISVDGLSGVTGDVKLSLTPVTPTNDNFASATTLSSSLPVNVTAYNVGATTEAGEPVHDGVSNNNSVWFNWTAGTSGLVTVSTAGSNFDTVLAVYTGTSVSSLTPVAANDDTTGLTSQLSFTAVAGTTYRITVAGFEGAQGTIQLTLS